MGGCDGEKRRAIDEVDEELSDITNPAITLFAATDGSTLYLTHNQPIPLSPPNTKLHPRSGYNAYNHIGAGGVFLLGNSDPVSTWSETMNWLNGRTEANGSRPYDYFLAVANAGSFLGHSLTENVRVVEKGEKGFNGQWAMVGEMPGFSPKWEGDFNWCFGAYRTNC